MRVSFYGMFTDGDSPALHLLNCDEWHDSTEKAVEAAQWLFEKHRGQYQAILVLRKGEQLMIVTDQSLWTIKREA